MNSSRVMIMVALTALAGCATTARPVLYPNERLKSVGNAAAQRDVDQCMQMADDAGVSRSSNQVVRRGAEGAAVGGAAAAVGQVIRGGSAGEAAAVGAAIGGTAGAVHGAFQNNSNPTYRNFVQRCLRERGYDVIGWDRD